jgi:PilZ domain
MQPNRHEFPCQITDISPGGMALITPASTQIGERIIAYADHVGRLEGVITRQFPNGFAIAFASTARKRDKLAAQLTWLANRHLLDLPEQRRDDRLTPSNPVTRLILPSGLNITCRLIQISQSGANDCE